MDRSTFWLAACCLLLLAPGCVTHAANRVTIVPDGQPEITILNSGLQSECEILGSRGFYEGEILAGAVELRSHVDAKQSLEGRFSWFDADGLQLETSPWEVLFVNALEEKQVQGRATEPGAARGLFELRRFTGRGDGDR
ncbi:MAG: DUF1425 domain-containing protein [Planctomycetota bacterium]|nr:MAG: DUF1425 domain-containing protein [Planctomycetota bacterium]